MGPFSICIFFFWMNKKFVKKKTRRIQQTNVVQWAFLKKKMGSSMGLTEPTTSFNF
jgi:hypothetical protein